MRNELTAFRTPPRRNLVAAVSNTWDNVVISAFDYTNDALGRRTARVDSISSLASARTLCFHVCGLGDFIMVVQSIQFTLVTSQHSCFTGTPSNVTKAFEMIVFQWILIALGLIIFLIGSTCFIVAECSVSIWWFLGGLLIPALPLVFLCVHFREGWPSAKTMLTGFLFLFIGSSLPDLVTAFHALVAR